MTLAVRVTSLFLVVFSFTSLSFADHVQDHAAPHKGNGDKGAKKADEVLRLRIRCIRSLGQLDDAAFARRENVLIDTRLRDLDRELHALPYQMYQLLDEKVVTISSKRKQDLRLVTGQVLRLRLLSSKEDPMSIWLRWQEKAGDILLDTRIHLSYGHSVLAGAESLNRTGVVLALEPAR